MIFIKELTKWNNINSSSTIPIMNTLPSYLQAPAKSRKGMKLDHFLLLLAGASRWEGRVYLGMGVGMIDDG
jgi:hypothetical protein